MHQGAILSGKFWLVRHFVKNSQHRNIVAMLVKSDFEATRSLSTVLVHFQRLLVETNSQQKNLMAERRPIKVISKLPTSHDAMHKKAS